MNILILGSGGREHALGWKLAQSSDCDKVYFAPGNAGTSAIGENLRLDPLDFDAVAKATEDYNIGFIMVGPEEPLVKGITDFFRKKSSQNNVAIFGPTAKGAELEGSKSAAKQFMQRHNIPTAAYKEFTNKELRQALDYVKQAQYPLVVKADGLAAGKGVRVCEVFSEAEEHLRLVLEQQKFGAEGARVVIEEFLDGIELSIFAITDGEKYVLMPSAKDYKRIGEGDTGPNTGGMGAISPVPFLSEDLLKKVEERVVKPTVEGLSKENIDYRGFIYFGLINVNGDPYVIEYNVRLGDPETQAVLPRIKSDLLQVCYQAAQGNLQEPELQFDDSVAATVVLVSEGYPGSYEKGKVIKGMDLVEDSLVFHAGTKPFDDDVITAGGRVLAITSLAENMQEALSLSFKSAEAIDFAGKYYRSDIGHDLKKFTTK